MTNQRFWVIHELLSKPQKKKKEKKEKK